MTGRAIAARYAKALFEVALTDGDPRAIEPSLAAFVDQMTKLADLHHALTSPAVPVQKKQALVAALTERAGTTPIVARTLALLASRDRLALLPDLLADYRERLLAREGVLRAEMTTSTPVPAERVRQIEHGIAAATGKQVTLEARVDPAIVGGIVARIGSTVYDASLATQLRKVRESLMGR
jgi:F-type H+-transporting ATPase subunit delta